MVKLRVARSPAGFDRTHSAAFARQLREAQWALRSKAMQCGTEPAKPAEYSPQLHHEKNRPLGVFYGEAFFVDRLHALSSFAMNLTA